MNALNLAEIGFLKALQQAISCPALDRFFGIVTSLGNGGALWIVLAFVLLAIPRTRRVGVSMIIAMALSFVFGNLILKNIIARPRPYQVDPSICLAIRPPREYSFPSGHTINAFSASVALWRDNSRAGRIAIVFAAVIAFTRLYFCVHYPTDVLGGIVFGFIFGTVSGRIRAALEERRAAHV